MKQKFTPNHLIKYLYKETSAVETLAISEALRKDDELFEQYQELVLSFRQLPKVKFNPSPASIQNILDYSQQTTLETH